MFCSKAVPSAVFCPSCTYHTSPFFFLLLLTTYVPGSLVFERGRIVLNQNTMRTASVHSEDLKLYTQYCGNLFLSPRATFNSKFNSLIIILIYYSNFKSFFASAGFDTSSGGQSSNWSSSRLTRPLAYLRSEFYKYMNALMIPNKCISFAFHPGVYDLVRSAEVLLKDCACLNQGSHYSQPEMSQLRTHHPWLYNRWSSFPLSTIGSNSACGWSVLSVQGEHIQRLYGLRLITKQYEITRKLSQYSILAQYIHDIIFMHHILGISW